MILRHRTFYRRVLPAILIIALIAPASTALLPQLSEPAAAVGTAGRPGFHSIIPTRVLDSRPASQVGPYNTPWGASATRDLKIAGAAGSNVPANATAVVIKIGVSDQTMGSYLKVWQAGSDQPPTSNVNFDAGTGVGPRANLALVPLGSSPTTGAGSVSIFNANGSANVIADIQGWYDDGTDPTGIGFVPASTPTRVLDSRPASQVGPYNTPWGTGTTRDLKIAGAAGSGVPATATAVVLNLAVSDQTLNSYLTAWPAGIPRPTVSNINFDAGSGFGPRSILAVVPVGTSPTTGAGSISLWNANGSTNIIADVQGWFDASNTASLGVMAPTPVRVLDSRSASQVGPYNTTWSAGTTRDLKIAGAVGSGVPATATAVVFKVGVSDQTSGSFLTVWPAGKTRPTAANLNFDAGTGRGPAANLTIVPLGTSATTGEGSISIYNALGNTNVIGDIQGYFDSGSRDVTGAVLTSGSRAGSNVLFGVRSTDGEVVTNEQLAPFGAFASWQPLGSATPADGSYQWSTPLGVGVNVDGTLDVVALARHVSGSTATWRLLHARQNGSTWPASWEVLATNVSSNGAGVSVGRNQNGTLDVFWIGADNALYHLAQSAAGTWASNPTTILDAGTVWVGTPSLSKLPDGRQLLTARAATGRIYRRTQTTANIGSAWDAKVLLPGTNWIGSPRTASNIDGRVAVFATTSAGGVSRLAQNADGTWPTAWTAITGLTVPTPPNPVPAVAPVAANDGHLEVYSIDWSGPTLRHTWQGTPGDDTTWNAWADVASATYAPAVSLLGAAGSFRDYNSPLLACSGPGTAQVHLPAAQPGQYLTCSETLAATATPTWSGYRPGSTPFFPELSPTGNAVLGTMTEPQNQLKPTMNDMSVGYVSAANGTMTAPRFPTRRNAASDPVPSAAGDTAVAFGKRFVGGADVSDVCTSGTHIYGVSAAPTRGWAVTDAPMIQMLHVINPTAAGSMTLTITTPDGQPVSVNINWDQIAVPASQEAYRAWVTSNIIDPIDNALADWRLSTSALSGFDSTAMPLPEPPENHFWVGLRFRRVGQMDFTSFPPVTISQTDASLGSAPTFRAFVTNDDGHGSYPALLVLDEQGGTLQESGQTPSLTVQGMWEASVGHADRDRAFPIAATPYGEFIRGAKAMAECDVLPASGNLVVTQYGLSANARVGSVMVLDQAGRLEAYCGTDGSSCDLPDSARVTTWACDGDATPSWKAVTARLSPRDVRADPTTRAVAGGTEERFVINFDATFADNCPGAANPLPIRQVPFPVQEFTYVDGAPGTPGSLSPSSALVVPANDPNLNRSGGPCPLSYSRIAFADDGTLLLLARIQSTETECRLADNSDASFTLDHVEALPKLANGNHLMASYAHDPSVPLPWVQSGATGSAISWLYVPGSRTYNSPGSLEYSVSQHTVLVVTRTGVIRPIRYDPTTDSLRDLDYPANGATTATPGSADIDLGLQPLQLGPGAPTLTIQKGVVDESLNRLYLSVVRSDFGLWTTRASTDVDPTTLGGDRAQFLVEVDLRRIGLNRQTQ